MLRLFVAITPPEEIRDRLVDLEGGLPGARWTDFDNLHLTLRFIGEVGEGEAADIDAALAEVSAPAFDLTLDGIGTFGTGRNVRALWAGVERCEALAHLQAKIESAVARSGQPPETRRFTPHVTIARLNRDAHPDRLGRYLADHGLFRAGPFRVDHFTLYRSHLGKGAAVYEPLREHPLAEP